MRTEPIAVEVAPGKKVMIETVISGEEQVSFSSHQFSGLTDAITDISALIIKAIEAVKPNSAEVEFGIDAAVESGNLTALLVKGTGTANLKVKLKWEAK